MKCQWNADNYWKTKEEYLSIKYYNKLLIICVKWHIKTWGATILLFLFIWVTSNLRCYLSPFTAPGSLFLFPKQRNKEPGSSTHSFMNSILIFFFKPRCTDYNEEGQSDFGWKIFPAGWTLQYFPHLFSPFAPFLNSYFSFCPCISFDGSFLLQSISAIDLNTFCTFLPCFCSWYKTGVWICMLEKPEYCLWWTAMHNAAFSVSSTFIQTHTFIPSRAQRNRAINSSFSLPL